jgi:hypothetical protein
VKPCIFCGDPADSKEDLFPRWILKRVKTRESLYRQVGNAPPEITENQEVRVPCVCTKCNTTWMSRMESTVKKFLGPMIEDFSLPLDPQNQRNLSEWAVKCAMCNDTVDSHPRFFTDAECHAFKQKRTIPEGTLVFAARFIGRSLDSNGVDFTLTEPKSGALLVRAHIYNVLVGHVVLQVLSWHPEPAHQGKIIRFAVRKGPWSQFTIQVWPARNKPLTWPPPMSLSVAIGITYPYFRVRFKNDTADHLLLTPKPSVTGSPTTS